MIEVDDRFVPAQAAGPDQEIEVIRTGADMTECRKVDNGVTFTVPTHMLLDPLRWTRLPRPADHVAPTPLPGVKWDAKKIRYDLIPPSFSRGLAAVLTYGAAKYSDDNWSKVPDLRRRYYAALLRHLESWRSGEALDSESGLPHLDHAAACLAFLRADAAGEHGTSLAPPGRIAP